MESSNSLKDRVKVYNLIILDKSGSMSSIANAAIAGFNETLGGIRSAQKKYAETQEHYVSLLTFCGCERKYVYDCVPIDKTQNLESKDYQPCCTTPLYDAMGQGINDLLKKTKELELASVVVTIITDGMENASTEYSGKAIKSLVEKMQNDYGWSFSYIGTNQDVDAVAKGLSIQNTMYFSDDNEGMAGAWEKERRSRSIMYERMDNMVSFSCEESDDASGNNIGRMSKLKNMLHKMSTGKKYLKAEDYSHRVTPDNINSLHNGQIFVFGSNEQGMHGGGASRTAVVKFGAIMGQGEGLQGASYAIPTMEGIEKMAEHIKTFIQFAKTHPELTFLVTRIGCGIAGYSVKEVAPLFIGAIDVENIWLPKDFWDELF